MWEKWTSNIILLTAAAFAMLSMIFLIVMLLLAH